MRHSQETSNNKDYNDAEIEADGRADAGAAFALIALAVTALVVYVSQS